MKFSDVEQLLDIARSDRERVGIIKRLLPKLRGNDLRSAMIVLANLYALQKKFELAATAYDMVGMHEEALKARSLI